MKPTFLALFATLAFGQIPADQDAVVALSNKPSPESVKQMTTIVKLLGNARDVTFDETHSSFSLRGYANALGLSEWLLHAMDKPSGWQPSAQDLDNPSAREYQIQPGLPFDARSPVARVYYLKNATSRQGLQEMLTALRVVGDIAMVFECDQPPMMAFRGTATTVDLAEWMIRKLDTPVARRNTSTDVFKLPNMPDGTDDVVQVFYLEPTTTPQVLNALTRKIRAANIGKAFQFTSPPAITARGSSAMLADVQQIIDSR